MTKADEFFLEFIKINKEGSAEEAKKFLEKVYSETEYLCFPIAYHRFKDGSILKTEEKKYYLDSPDIKEVVFNDGVYKDK